MPVEKEEAIWDLTQCCREEMIERELIFKLADDVGGKGIETAGTQGGRAEGEGQVVTLGGGKVDWMESKVDWMESTRKKRVHIAATSVVQDARTLTKQVFHLCLSSGEAWPTSGFPPPCATTI